MLKTEIDFALRRVLDALGHLPLLAPDIIEAILDGRQPAAMTPAVLMRPFVMGWEDQKSGLSS